MNSFECVYYINIISYINIKACEFYTPAYALSVTIKQVKRFKDHVKFY